MRYKVYKSKEKTAEVNYLRLNKHGVLYDSSWVIQSDMPKEIKLIVFTAMEKAVSPDTQFIDTEPNCIINFNKVYVYDETEHIYTIITPSRVYSINSTWTNDIDDRLVRYSLRGKIEVVGEYGDVVREKENKEKFYFTYGSSNMLDYQGGHIVIYAENYQVARRKYEKRFGFNESKLLGFASQYNEDEWEGVVGNQHCHEVIK